VGFTSCPGASGDFLLTSIGDLETLDCLDCLGQSLAAAAAAAGLQHLISAFAFGFKQQL
jgi:hypothetical protein